MAKTSRVHQARIKRHKRVRSRVSGTGDRPRLNVYRSLDHIYAQVIDDTVGHTLVSASSLDGELREQCSGLKKTDAAKIVGRAVAEKALKGGVVRVVCDRGGYQYHGRVKALAEAAREAGLEF